jgi:hypothetical protein
MNDEPKRRPWAWVGWIVLLPVLYFVSAVPASLVTAWMVEWNVISPASAENFMNTAYAPIDKFPPARRAAEAIFDAMMPLFPAPRP